MLYNLELDNWVLLRHSIPPSSFKLISYLVSDRTQQHPQTMVELEGMAVTVSVDDDAVREYKTQEISMPCLHKDGLDFPIAHRCIESRPRSSYCIRFTITPPPLEHLEGFDAMAINLSSTMGIFGQLLSRGIELVVNSRIDWRVNRSINCSFERLADDCSQGPSRTKDWSSLNSSMLPMIENPKRQESIAKWWVFVPTV